MNAKKWKWWAGLIVAAALIAAAIYFRHSLRDLLHQSLNWIASLGIWGPVIFALIYIVAAVFFLPAWVLTVGAGALFGVVKGSILVSISSTLGAIAACLVGRYFARDWVAKRIEGNSKFTAIDQAVAKEGWKIVGLVRLSPVFPFSLMNYAFGLTRVSLRDYALASWIGMMPGTVMYVYFGSLAHAGAQHTTTLQWILRGIGLAATIVVTVMLTRIAKKALAKKIHQ